MNPEVLFRKGKQTRMCIVSFCCVRSCTVSHPPATTLPLAWATASAMPLKLQTRSQTNLFLPSLSCFLLPSFCPPSFLPPPFFWCVCICIGHVCTYIPWVGFCHTQCLDQHQHGQFKNPSYHTASYGYKTASRGEETSSRQFV